MQIQKRRAARKQAQDDMSVLNQSTMDIDSQPPEAQFQAAQAFADDHRARVAREQGQPPSVRQPLPQTPETTPQQPTRPYPLPPPYQAPQPDTSTQIPQSPDWRDTPERQARGPVDTNPQQQSFGQAQASFDNAVARQMEMMAGFVLDSTRRIEELECWRESTSQE